MISTITKNDFSNGVTQQSRYLISTRGVEMTLLSALVGIINNFFYNNFYIMFIFMAIEIAALLYCIVLKKNEWFVVLFVLFLSSSLENAALVNGQDINYGIKGFKIAGINLSVYIFAFFVVFYMLTNKAKFSQVKTIRFLQIGSLAIALIGFISGYISYADNFNRINRYKYWLGSFLRWGYSYSMIALELVFFSMVVLNCKKKDFFGKMLLYIACGQILATAASRILGNFNYVYGEVAGIISPTTLIHLTYIIIFPLYKCFNQAERLVIAVFGILNILISIKFAGGQGLLMIAIIPLIICLILFQSHRIGWGILVAALTLTVGLFVLFLLNAVMSGGGDSRIYEEYEDVVSMLSFQNNDWIENMGHSPKVRIAEILNVVHQYAKEPFRFLSGRGFLGTYCDNLNILDTVVPSDYLEWERKYKMYSSVHESFAQFLLYFGLFGVIFYLVNMKNIIVNLSNSPWLLVGISWFGLHYAFSMTAISFGTLSLVVGLSDAHREVVKKKGS